MCDKICDDGPIQQFENMESLKKNKKKFGDFEKDEALSFCSVRLCDLIGKQSVIFK